MKQGTPKYVAMLLEDTKPRFLAEHITAPRPPFAVAQPQAATERIVRRLLLGEAVESCGVRLEHEIPYHQWRVAPTWVVLVNGEQRQDIRKSSIESRAAVQIATVAALLLTLGFDPAHVNRSAANVHKWNTSKQGV